MRSVCIEDVKQTCLFVREEVLKNVVELTIFNEGKAFKATLVISWPSSTYEIPLGCISAGRKVYRVRIPDIREEADVKFSVRDEAGNVVAEKAVSWRPRKRWIIYLVQYSHHDLGYTDIPQNVLKEYVDFYDSIIRLCEETEDWPEEVKFRYQVEQFWSINYYLKTQPKRKVDRLLKLLKEGRVEVSALFGNEVSGLCGHEEIIRLVYPSLRLRSTHGIPVSVAELNDVPGLSWGLATVLAGSGVEVMAPLLPRRYYRPDQMPFWDESIVTPGGIPTAFWWESLDGGRVLFWYQNIDFGGNVGFAESYEKLLKELPKFLDGLEEKGYPFDAILVRVRGAARDNSPPSIKPCLIAKEWNEKWAYPRIVVSTLSSFFKHLEENYGEFLKKLPVFKGEIPDSDYPVGATSTMQATILNRNAHDLIPSAEKFATIADRLLGLPYPHREYLKRAYEHNLLYDEHTWGLCCPFGPAQEASRIEKVLHAHKAYTLAHDVLVKSLNRIVDAIDLSEEGYYLIVFNPLSWKRTDVVRAWLREPDPCGHPMYEVVRDGKPTGILAHGNAVGRDVFYPPLELFEKPFSIVDLETGKKVECQTVVVKDPASVLDFAADRVGLAPREGRYVRQVVFVAEDVPSVGYKVYKIVAETKSPSHNSGEERGADSCVIENEYYRVVVDPNTGAVTSLFDKELGRELVDSKAPHGFSQLIVRESTTGKEHYVERVRVRKGLDGPIIKSIVVEGRAYGCPLVVKEIILYSKVKKVDLYYRILKDSTSMLEVYMAFPFKMHNPSFKYEGPNIVVTPIEDQFPGSHTCYYPVQHWVSVCDDDGFGVTWSSVDAHLVELGGLWPLGVSWAHHGVTSPNYPHENLRVSKFEKAYIYSFVLCNNFRTNFYTTQVGDMVFRYSITSHMGDWRTGISRNHGWNAANPLVAVFAEGGSRGKLPSKSYSFCEVDKPNVMITAIKPSEDGKGLVLRLVETSGRDTTVTVKLPFLSIEKAYVTNLVEEELKPVEVQGDRITTTIRAFEIATLKLIVKASLSKRCGVS